MNSRPVNTEPLHSLVQSLIDADDRFDQLWIEHKDLLEELVTSTEEQPLANQLIGFVNLNLEPVSELPAGEGKKLAKRLARLLKQADRLLAGEIEGYPKEVANAIKGPFWPEPPSFEIKVVKATPNSSTKGSKKGKASEAVAEQPTNVPEPEPVNPGESVTDETDFVLFGAEEESVIPEEESVIPEEESVIPEEESVLPEEDSVLPEEDSVLPEEDSVLPEEESVLPEEESVLPEEESVLPEEESVIPEEESVLPEEESVLPEEDSVIPEEGAVLPEEKSVLPDEGAELPHEESILQMDDGAEVQQLSQRLSEMACKVEPTLMETLLELLEVKEEEEWVQVLERSAALLEPFSIAAEMMGFEPLDGLLKRLDARLRTLAMPVNGSPRCLVIQGLADLPGLFGALFSATPEEIPELGEALLKAVGAPEREAVSGGEALISWHQQLAPVAEAGLMELDAAGIEEMLLEAISIAEMPQSAEAGEPPVAVESESPQSVESEVGESAEIEELGTAETGEPESAEVEESEPANADLSEEKGWSDENISDEDLFGVAVEGPVEPEAEVVEPAEVGSVEPDIAVQDALARDEGSVEGETLSSDQVAVEAETPPQDEAAMVEELVPADDDATETEPAVPEASPEEVEIVAASEQAVSDESPGEVAEPAESESGFEEEAPTADDDAAEGETLSSDQVAVEAETPPQDEAAMVEELVPADDDATETEPTVSEASPEEVEIVAASEQAVAEGPGEAESEVEQPVAGEALVKDSVSEDEGPIADPDLAQAETQELKVVESPPQVATEVDPTDPPDQDEAELQRDSANPALDGLMQRLAELAATAEPALLEAILQLLEVEEEGQWQRTTAYIASLLEPFSIAVEMIGVESLDPLMKELDAGLRGLPMPADEAARGELVQGMADLPGLFGAFFMSPQEDMGDLAGAMLTAIGQGQQAQVVGQSLTTLRDELAPVAEDGLMILDSAGIDELLEQAIANGVPQSETVEQGEAAVEEAESHSAESHSVEEPSGQAGADDGEEVSDEGQASTPEELPASIPALDGLMQRLAELAATAEPALLEAVLQLLEVEEEGQWQRTTAYIASLLEPFSIAVEMIGVESLDPLMKELDAGLRGLPMPADEAARGELVQGMADLPGLFGAFFMSPQEDMGDLAGAMLTAIGQGQQAQVVGQSLTTLRDDLVPVAEDGLMILDAAGIDELLEQAIANGVPQSETVEQGEVVPEEAESHSAEAWSGQAGADEGGEAIDEGQAATAHEPPAPPAIEAATPPAEEQTPAAVEEEEPEVNPFSDETMELLGLLAAGVSESQEELENEAAHLATAESVSWESELRHYADILERVVMAAETIEFTALHGAASRMVEKIRSTPYPEEEGNRQQLSETLHAFPQVLLDFLAAPHKDAGLLALYASFEAAGAFDGLGDKERMDYLDGLSRGPADDEVQEEVPTVEAADLVLKPDSDADASVLESVAGEGPRLAGEFAQLLQQVIAGEEIEENLRKAQRTVHTLKGSANICGIRGIANLSHHLEDLLEHLGEKGEAPDDTLSEVLVDAADALESSLEVVFSGEEHDAKVFAEIVAKVVGWSYGIRHGLGEPVEVQLGEGVGVAEDPAESQAESAGKATSGAAQAAPSGDLVDGLQKQMGELSIALTQAESRIAAARQSLDQMVDQHLTNMRNVEKLEELADIRGLGTRFTNLFGGGEKASSDSYDPLEMEEYNELYITTRRLHEGEADAQALAEGLDQAIKVLEELSQIQLRLNHETQDLIAAARQVPVGQYIPRLQRVVRQTCRSTGKDAEMIVDGGELEVDNEVMEKLLPALLHILRNAIDHGVESAESRIAAGKPEEGRLSLSFNRVGNAIEVVFSDDGAGLDYDRVRRKAVKNGLIDESARLENRELALLTLKPGFSTQEQVSEISGRGVGMNVVDAAIRELKGALSIDSETGKGYTLTMRVPTSTISMYTLLVRIGEETFAIPGSEIKYAAPFADGEIVQEGGVDYFRYGEERYPLEELGYLIGQKRSSRDSERPIVLIAYSDVDERAVLADALTDSRMVIAKKLGDYVPPIPGVSSATILGDGSIVPILELRRLLRREGFVESLGAFEVADEDAIKAPGILIVDDSLSMRKSLSQLVVDGGFRALTATDGMDALRVVEEEMPDVVLVDMEMPHMNGLELTSHLRANAATNHLPIAMITSRATASHREKALDAGVDHYFIKPYKEDEVLEFIEQRLLARGSGGNDHD